MNQHEDLRQHVQEIKELRFEKKWTLKMIADKFGVSRERVRQVLGNTGKGYTKQRIKAEMGKVSGMSNKVIAGLLGISPYTVVNYRNGERHQIDGGNLKVGTEIEDFVSVVLKERGIEHQLMPHHHPFDILLENGLRIDVKSSMPSKSLSINSPLYSFNASEKRRGRYADFFILVTRDTKEFFVVPATETRDNTPIRFCFPESGMGRESKWLKYHNRFDLLQNS